MKKLSILLALILICSSLSGVVSLADTRGTYTITFFTNDEHLLIGWDLNDRYHKTVVRSFDYGHVITEDDLPFVSVLLCGFRYGLDDYDSVPRRGWVENPIGYTVEKDMAFEMYVANKPEELANVRFFGAGLILPGDDYYGNYDDVTIGYPVGYTLTSADIPHMPDPPLGGYGWDKEVIWTPDPVGVTVYGGEEFESELVDILAVYFGDSHQRHRPSGDWLIEAHHDLEYGASVRPPAESEIPQYPDEVFIGWSSDSYLHVTGCHFIWTEYRPLGDANTDGVVNSGDAAYILRHSLGLTKSEVHNFDKLADYNNDGAINTGDAAGVLAYAVNG